MHAAHDIATFIRVVDLGSFAAVATESGLTPSAISKIVSRLEDRLGVKLLQRTTRRLALTQEGETYAIRGREILAAIEAAEAEVTAGRGQPQGHIRINTGTAFAKYHLAGVLPEFHKRYPGHHRRAVGHRPPHRRRCRSDRCRHTGRAVE
ncbi:LysR family transcriptional regulator [Bradyrhizobium sp. TZ2]